MSAAHPKGTRLALAATARQSSQPVLLSTLNGAGYPAAGNYGGGGTFTGSGAGADAIVPGGLSYDSTSSFAVGQPDYNYDDGNPFNAHTLSAQSAANLSVGYSGASELGITSTANQRSDLIGTPFGVIPSATQPVAKGCGPGCHASQQQQAYIQYAEYLGYGLLVVAAIYFVIKAYRK